ncbi:hypothetical protein [Pontivivens ytuae]|uniref:Uncharacterized protein n=1 Tax=Pontivivens ytuae TaxID=2789856 RepID=A0A7S9LTI9_9RHOB|nr:hypothetical protein [Pontivivens ytuae]QPH55021.1 hypothetical protein I0K15_04525 [Pontivivens ytuae]
MTALDQYDRLEAVGLWQAAADASPREVIVTFGNATLTLMDSAEAPLAHWSLAAVEECDGPGLTLSPDPASGERLEIRDTDMIAAIRAVHSHTERQEAEGRRASRLVPLLLLAVLLAGAAVFLRVPAQAALANRITEQAWVNLSEQLAEDALAAPGVTLCPALGRRAPAELARIATRLGPDMPRLRPILVRMERPWLPLPGPVFLIDAGAIESAGQVEEIAGLTALAAAQRTSGAARDTVVEELGLPALLRLASSGTLPAEDRREVLAALVDLSRIGSDAMDAEALRRLESAGLPSLPLGLLLARTGAPEARVERLQAGDTIGTAAYRPALSDGDWLTLQAACR